MFHKVMFSSSHGTTAGLILNVDGHDPIDIRDVVAVSRLYPYTEARKMHKYHVSPAFQTFDEAFAYVFPIDCMGNDVTHKRQYQTR